MDSPETKDFSELFSILNYSFKSVELIRTALTHSSVGKVNYERLEFLGDAVLELFTSERLYKKYPNYNEGELTKLRSKIVCEESLCAFSKSIGLNKYIILGNSELQSGGMEKSSIISDVVESVIGAMYLDGGIAEVKALVENINNFAEKLINSGELRSDYKTELQEFLQRLDKNPKIEYVEAEKSGTDNSPIFKTNLYIKGKLVCCGTGKSKKTSEQNAAKKALINLKKR